jgi:Nif-specific regulatory protein
MATDAERMLHRLQLETLYQVSVALSRSLDVKQTPQEVLRILEEAAGLTRGMLCVLDPDSGDLVVNTIQTADEGTELLRGEPVRYRIGEGVLGLILEEGKTVALPAILGDPRFLNRLGIYERRLPFIAAPIHVGGALQGVLAVQPNQLEDGSLEHRARFVEMVANLIGQTLKLSLDVAQEKRSLADERDALRLSMRAQHGFGSIAGQSAAMRRVFEQVRMVCRWDTTVLIRGETGTGKELIANAIHYNSPRARGPYVRLNCASLPENLLESELFGSERGAYTGAVTTRKGRFEQASGGTILLDEIGEISPAFQAKLLRVLQEGELERVGGGRTIKVDVRVIAATHRDLEDAVDSGRFREDLYFRLNVMPITLPALRERMEDVPDIARHLIDRIAQGQRRPLELSEAALARLTQFSWPGNVRELENCLERAAVMSVSGHIDADLIRIDRHREAAPVSLARVDLDDPTLDERTRVTAALEQAGWVQAKAARLLNMTPRQIAYRIQMLAIEVRRI